MERLVLDTNLLLLWLVGSASQRLIAVHKRTKVFVPADFALLGRIVAEARTVIVTSHVLAETSNLLLQCRPDLRAALASQFRRMVEAVDEQGRPARQMAATALFPRLGLTDATLVELAREGATIVTADLEAYLAAAAVNPNTVNFNHLRDQPVR